MRNGKFPGDFRIILILLVLCCFSCNKDEDYPHYPGRWMTTKGVPASGGFTIVRYYLELSENGFTESFVDYNQKPDINYPKYVSIKGSVFVAGDIMTFTPEELSYSRYDENTSTHSDPYAVYTKERDNIGSMLSGLVLLTSGHHVQYTVTGNKLTLKVDYNRNDDFSDDHPAYSYDRQ
ncbi:MAG: hypothetical protein AB2L20_33605 [Mangrovibacterium sp.]